MIFNFPNREMYKICREILNRESFIKIGRALRNRGISHVCN